MGDLENLAASLGRGDTRQTAAVARQIAQTSPADPERLSMAGLALQSCGALSEAFDLYARALALRPDDPDIALALASAARQTGRAEAALQLGLHALAARPDEAARLSILESLISLGRLGDGLSLAQEWREEATSPGLGLMVGRLLRYLGALDESQTLLSGLVQANPADAAILHEASLCLADQGDIKGAIDLINRALSLNIDAEKRASFTFNLSTLLLADGRLAEGWDAYAARLDPNLSSSPVFEISAPRAGEGSISGKHVLLVSEQGLGDEISFYGAVPDLLRELTDEGRLTIAADRRLLPMVERSFAGVQAVAHKTTQSHLRRRRALAEPAPNAFDLWLPSGDLMVRYRRALPDFERPPAYLKVDARRLVTWSDWLAALPPGPTIGLTWRSGKSGEGRALSYAPLAAYRHLAGRGQTQFISLQYGATPDEIAQIQAVLGAPLLVPPDLDLFEDLEGLAALCLALDLVIGIANATVQLAGAVGAPLWVITAPKPWPAFGTDHYPFYPQARAFSAVKAGDWDEVLARVGAALAQFRPERSRS